MKLFLIEAYGGPTGTDSKIEHFTVRARTLDEAVDLVRHSAEGGRFGHFDLVEESVEFPGEGPAILDAGEDSYLECP
jgi:hypothetical protein